MNDSISVAADLTIESDSHKILILSDSEEIGIAIMGDSIPKFGISSLQAIKMLRSMPEIKLEQRLTIVLNQKEIYRSDKSLFNQSNKFLLVRLFFKNLF